MSKETNKATDQALIALVGNSGNSGSAQERLAAILSAKLLKEEAEKDAETQRLEEYKQSLRTAINKTMADKVAVQNSCPHMKPNFRPALGGQRDHSGNYHYICQYCTKEWNTKDGPLPYHLQIPADMVGGPQ